MTFKRFATVLAAALCALAVSGSALAAQVPFPVKYTSFKGSTGFAGGAFAGTRVSGDALVLGSAAPGTWTSPQVTTGFGFAELVASWNADTPAGTYIQVEMQGVTSKGTETKWYVMGKWAYGEETILRTSVGGQGDADGFIAIDTFFAKDKPLVAYRLKVTLFGSGGVSPAVRMVGAFASDPRNAKPAIPSPLGVGVGTELNVPTYSQEIHAGQYPQFDNGGEAWCSPTSTSMVLAYWGSGPTSGDYGWVDPAFDDPWVDHAARYTFDYHYDGAGNWPFNTAYAAHWGLDGFVTQLHSLTEAEQFIKAGIPLVASVAAGPNKLTGFLLDKGTNGHLLVISGFTASGDVIVRDPAAESNGTVRRTYDRAEFERAWLPASGGVVYVITPHGMPLPVSLAGNW
jgi:Peptidase_C39 like family